MEKVRFHEMLPHEIAERQKKFPAAFIGVGALEWHGKHMAFGNDALKAEKLCELAAERSGGFAMPTLWYGEPRTLQILEHDDVPHGGGVARYLGWNVERLGDKQYFRKTSEAQVEAFAALIYHMLIQMNTFGMKAVCLVFGHYPLHKFCQKHAIDRFNREFPDTKVFGGIEPAYVAQEFQDKDVGGDHGGIWETSYLWYLRPDCVDMSMLRTSDNPTLGVGSDCVDATIEKGRRACNLIVDGMVLKARELIAQAS